MDSSRLFKMGIIFILLTLISCTSIGLVQGCSSNPGRLRVIKPYRSDYEYNQHTDAFYKLHTHPSYYPPAERRCAEEGGWLAPPAFASSPQEMAQYVRMMKRFPDIGDYIYVDNDINRMNEEEMIERFGTTRSYPDLPGPPQPLCDVFTRRGEGEILPCGRQKLPFICKVEAKDAHFDKECNVFSVGYRKGENLNSCYGIPSTPYSWDQAYAECAAQGAHLVVLNSKAEHDFVQYFMETNPGVYGAGDSTLFFAGYRGTEVADGSPKVFKTIFNETLEEAGFSQWARDRPNNTKDEVCVALNINTGNLEDVNCEQLLGFICEKEIPSH